MHDLDRIIEALSTRDLDTREFELCAVSFLGTVYDGLTSVPGGSDWGRDADIHMPKGTVPVRVIITSSRTLKGVQANLTRSLKSMDEHGVRVERVVLANRLDLGQLQQIKLEAKAAEWNVEVEAHFGREFFANRLRIDGGWRERLLGLSSHPITLSRLPAEIAESPWVHLPLTGRDQELDQLNLMVSEGDVIVTGRPGIGKSRLVSAMDGVLFVDHDVDPSSLAKDIRWLQPEYLAVDDAGQYLDLLRRLTTLRRSESDLAAYRIVAICWPDEEDAVRDRLQGAGQIDVDGLERPAVDEIIQAMGVRNSLGRSQILDQAEGRPGWAVALADMLLKTGTWQSIFDGKVILGQAARYLRRAGISAEAIGVLTALAALRFVTDDQVVKLARSLDISTSRVRLTLLGAARSGLVDVARGSTGSGASRTYTVRPPMLADVLVAEHAFRSDVPIVTLELLREEWPGREAQLAGSAIKAAQLGVSEAEPVARQFLQSVLESDQVSAAVRRELVREYADISASACQAVFGWIEGEFKTLSTNTGADLSRLEPLVGLAAHLVRRYSNAQAAILLLDAVQIDDRPSGRHPGHPLRAVQDLVQKFHPGLKPSETARRLIAAEAKRWIDARTTSPAAWVAYTAVCRELLSFKRDGSHLSPATGRELVLIETVLAPDEMQSVYDEVWLSIVERLRHAPAQARRGVVDVLAAWLRIGRGVDEPFGRPHAAESISRAAQLSRLFLEDLIPMTADAPGLQAALSDIARLNGIEVSLPPDELRDLFLADVAGTGRRRGALERRREEIGRLVATWSVEPPQIVLARLSWLQEQCELAGPRWPHRVRMAFCALAPHIEIGRLSDWIDGALNHGLFPDAAALLECAVQGGVLSTMTLQRCLFSPMARWPVINAILTCAEASADLVSCAIDALEASDYGILQTILFDDILQEGRRNAILASSDVNVRGAAALAMFETNLPGSEWLSGSIENSWLAAIEGIDLNALEPIREDVLHELAELLAMKRPETLYRLVDRQLRLLTQGVESWARHTLVDSLHALPAQMKTKLLQEFGDSSVRWLLLRRLPGNDVGWLESALDSELMTPEEALNCKDGLAGPEPSISDLARLLVPRGVSADIIACQAQWGVHYGEESDHLAALLEQFDHLARSVEPSVAAVGQAGVDIFKADHATALRKERRRRVMGL
ncbi:hypothetical protein [Amycolatopsis sp. lyj-84]|uniref:hypothetical protein n=1 Tax=Amycolatopsis sp. lyj-84 TaxID=2789284 RepID=UPI00397C9941